MPIDMSIHKPPYARQPTPRPTLHSALCNLAAWKATYPGGMEKKLLTLQPATRTLHSTPCTLARYTACGTALRFSKRLNAYILMAYVVLAYVAMAYVAMAYKLWPI